ncbi:aminotransferase class I/II-fold pyridoxal phosphate-dependent enzyme [Allopusillimonas soli]|uniref:Aminotransferase class I/II-fold pyridoxal phosphate-dependent enzyme n=2 Tax=Allopusillimonas soli TaxID=659016 RepID=A0A853F768_9BURK|nr:aminotransferase class I/II-fold pyridoxal phosphate-dependent enzyme [Allopusillimonas soli]NYT35827.1 aminotransferase class I/II-fold pyridoxal phosphate-dependent enzyme [Allopusillimonas soli]TEA76753.1 aminotransferase class I/II-fold pyridoxal phosphate-dependent enzyme [Allopusillimonas soli]
MNNWKFCYKIPLLNASLSQESATLAMNCINKQDHLKPSTDMLHRYVAEAWESPFVASFMGGRASLYAIVEVLGLQAGDQVLLPAFTCQAVANAFSFHGIEIIFVDIELETFGMDAAAARKAVTPRCKALLLQYTFGAVCRDTDALCALAREHGLAIIEDCAHATGGAYKTDKLGTLGDIAFFSSERSKMVNTIHGGWVITRDPRLGERLAAVHAAATEPDEAYVRALLRTLCQEWVSLQNLKGQPLPPEWRDMPAIPPSSKVPQMQPAELSGLFTPQYRWKMPACIAAILLQQLQSLPRLLERRRAGAAHWLEWAARSGVRHAAAIDGAEPTWLRFPILVDAETKRNPAAFSEKLGCEIGVWFTTPMHPQPLMLPDCPNGMYASAHCVNLPTWLPEEAGAGAGI